MQRLVRGLAATLTVAAVAACSDATGVQPEDLAGTWDISALEFTNVANTSEQVDLIADLSGSGTVTITGAGAFTIAVTVEGSTDTDIGTIEVVGSSVTITIAGDDLTGTISRSGDTVTINLTTGVEFDFDDDGTDEPATARLVMVKQ